MIAVYAGRFDPVTNGHLDILRRAAPIFEQVVVAVFDAPSDKTLFPTTQRVSMLQTIVRGLRAVTDFSVEFDQALMYKDMAPEIEQVYLMSDLKFVFVRAARIREVAAL